jgi:hypothetical protein
MVRQHEIGFTMQPLIDRQPGQSLLTARQTKDALGTSCPGRATARPQLSRVADQFFSAERSPAVLTAANRCRA